MSLLQKLTKEALSVKKKVTDTVNDEDFRKDLNETLNKTKKTVSTYSEKFYKTVLAKIDPEKSHYLNKKDIEKDFKSIDLDIDLEDFDCVNLKGTVYIQCQSEICNGLTSYKTDKEITVKGGQAIFDTGVCSNCARRFSIKRIKLNKM
tara:strand:- start:27738 stop:28181 length:444 start_codon:yes stop_codon:yes gene_type:complete